VNESLSASPGQPTEAALLERLAAAVTGRYRIVRELGRGGMAVVVLAEDLKQSRSVALKVMRPELAAELGPARFLREIRIAAGLQHPHILGLYDSDQSDGLLYYTMPHVEGESLRQRLEREGQLPIPEAIRIAGQVAEALGHAHRHGVVHRDIKPANILLVGNQALVADFGVARAVAEAGTGDLTGTGMSVGTPAYMSPELAGGDSHLDGRSDIYALGCVVYEMLAGEPPFGGRTAQVILARHLQEPPPSLGVVRPTASLRLQQAIERALAKVPADRFATAEEFGRELEAAARSRPRVAAAGRNRRWTYLVPGLAAAGLLAWGLSRALGPPTPALDPNRVVVFPLYDESGSGAGEAVATYVGYALEGTARLRWIEGWDWMRNAERPAGEPLPPGTAAAISRARRARYFIDGLIVRGRDSVTVVLRLHDIQGDSVVKRAGVSGAPDDPVPRLGLEAVAGLLPSLLEPGRPVDLSALAQRRPAAIAAFLQGEHDYRRASFASALEHYRLAVREDSSLAIAAIKGAQAANWRERNQEALALVQVALTTRQALPPRYARFALGLQHYLTGAADSAISEYRRAIALDPGWSEAWAALGETYHHLLPNVSAPDSLAEAAFTEARRSDTSFSPPLLHLAEMALRRGDLPGATRLIGAFDQADPDSAVKTRLEAMLACVRGGPAATIWERLAARRPDLVVGAAHLLSAGGSQLACATAGYTAVLHAAGSSTEQQWGAVLGLQSLLTARGRVGENRRLLDSKISEAIGGPVLYLIIATIDSAYRSRAGEVARQFGTGYRGMGSPVLWALATYAASTRDTAALAGIASELERRSDSSRTRRDSLLSNVVSADAALARGDSTGALQQLMRLTPNASLEDLEWQPWEALAGERLTLARLYLARGDYPRADQVAGRLEASQPVIHLAYLPAALAVRAEAAAALGEASRAAIYRRRTAALQR
jgi:serine/threonine-protein kinase